MARHSLDAIMDPRPSVFICYSHHDKIWADELIILLESHGFETIVDRDDLIPGELWQERLTSLLRRSDNVLLVVSDNWLNSRHCNDEVRLAKEDGKRLIPLLLGGVRLEMLPQHLKDLHCIDFHGGPSYAGGVAEVVRALRTDVDWVQRHTRYTDLARSGADNLLRGKELARALAWLRQQPPLGMRIGPDVERYISDNKVASDRDDRSKLRVHRAVLALLLMVVLLGAGLVAGIWRHREEQRRHAVLENEKKASDDRAAVLTDALGAQTSKVTDLETQLNALRGTAQTNTFDLPPIVQTLIYRLESYDDTVRRGTRKDLVDILDRLRDKRVNQLFVEEISLRPSYRKELGITEVISGLRAPEFADSTAARARLESLLTTTTDATLKASVSAAIEKTRR